MDTHEIGNDPILITIREFDEEDWPDPLLLVPTRRMARLIARAVGTAIPEIACPEEADEARGMVAFIEDYMETCLDEEVIDRAA